jgi:hypothetical protein
MIRKLRDPLDTRGNPTVIQPGTPVPRRAEPLPGTKKMSFPKDSHFAGVVNAHPANELKPPWVARLWGWLAMLGALDLIAMYWVGPHLPPNGWLNEYGTGIVILVLGLTHVFAVLSQVASDGRNQLGGLSVLVLYGGLILSLVLDHLLR